MSGLAKTSYIRILQDRLLLIYGITYITRVTNRKEAFVIPGEFPGFLFSHPALNFKSLKMEPSHKIFFNNSHKDPAKE